MCFQPGDQVWVRKPWKVNKREQRPVVRKKSLYTYLLDVRRSWNASHLSALPELNTTMDNDRELVNP